MRDSRSIFNRLMLAQLLVFALAFGFAQTAHAQGIVYGDTIPSGQVVEGDVVLFGERVQIDGDVIGDVFAFGSQVTVAGKVDGSLFVGGESVLIEGQVGGTTYSAAVTLELGPEASLQRNLYFAGLNLITQSGSEIGRDLYASSLLGAQLGGKIGGFTRAVIGPAEFLRVVLEAVGGEVNLPELVPAPESGSLPVYSTAGSSIGAGGTLGIIGLKSAAATFIPDMNSIEISRSDAAQQIDTDRLQAWGLKTLREFVTLLVYGFLILWLLFPWLSRSEHSLQNKPLPSTGYGLLGFVISLNIFGLALLLALLILFLGIWLGIATLWDLAFAFWTVAFLSLGLATTVFVLYFVYATKIIVAFWLGRFIIRLIYPKMSEAKMIPLLIGLLLYVLLHSVPFLGWVIGVAFTALGIGSTVVAYIDARRQASVEPTPA